MTTFTPSPYRSPAYLQAERDTDASTSAKVRGFGREAQTVRAELQRALPRIQWEGQGRREAIADDFESRGLFGSGARVVAQARSDRDTLADGSDLSQRAAEAVQGLMQRAAEARLAAQADLSNAAVSTFGDLASRQSEASLAMLNQRNEVLRQALQAQLGLYNG